MVARWGGLRISLRESSVRSGRKTEEIILFVRPEDGEKEEPRREKTSV